MKKIIDVSEIEAVFGKYDDGRLSLSVINDLRALLDKAPTLQDARLSIVVESAIKMLGNVEISDIKAPSVSGEAHYEVINAETKDVLGI